MKPDFTRVIHTKFGQNWLKTLREDVDNMNFPCTHITISMTMKTLTPKK